MTSDRDFLQAFAALKAEQQRLNITENILRQFSAGNLSEKELYDQMLGPPPKQPYSGTYNTYQPFRNLKDMNDKLAAQRQARDPATRKREIESELDIIRGKVPTPKGYVVDPGRVKILMQELKTLS